MELRFSAARQRWAGSILMFPNINHALRVLRSDLGFTAVAVFSLALGIGATSAMFTFADAMLLRPLPVREPDRVVTINTAVTAPWGQNPPISYPDYLDLRDRNRTFAGLTAASYARFGFSPNPETQPRMKSGLYVSGNFFRVLGVEPAIGRGFRPDEDQTEGRDAVVVLGYDFWVAQFGGTLSALGSRIRLNGVELTVIGVAPKRFTGIDSFLRPQVFVPLAMSPRTESSNRLHDRDFGWLIVRGRLNPGVSIERAQADIGALSAQLEKLHRVTGPDRRLQVETELQLRMAQLASQTTIIIMLGALGVCVLLVACANVAGLLLSRARGRSREIAVRLAIGASRGALIRQLLLENLLVAAAGGLASLWIADAFSTYMLRFPLPNDLPFVVQSGVDRRVLLFTLIVSVLSTLLFGLAPALRATRPNLVPALKAADADSAGKRRLWGRNTIVAGQVALSLVLLLVSATLVQGFREKLLSGPGYRIDRLFLTSFDTQLAHYSQDRTPRFYRELLDRARATPGVRSAALTSSVQMWDVPDSLALVPEGWDLPPGEPASTPGYYISDGYFETMAIPILQGRGFRESDGESATLVAVVNEYMADHYWKGDALGKRFHLGKSSDPLVEIVGIAKMSKYLWTAERPQSFIYLPFRQHPRARMTLLAESVAPEAGAVLPVLRDMVHKLDPDMPIFLARTMHELYADMAIGTSRLVTGITTAMGLLGLILATVGLYGLVAYSVSRRTREIGIRMALGAHRTAVVRMVLWQGLRLGVMGVAAGFLVALYACRAVTVFFSFARLGPLIYLATSLLLLVVTMLATWAPARHAARVDPLTSLRDE